MMVKSLKMPAWLLFSLASILIFNTQQVAGQKKLELKDIAYEPYIRTVQLFPATNAQGTELLPAAAPLGQSQLVLQFDDLNDRADSYYARIIHCNYDWSRSDLRDLDFLRDYNEWPINTYEFSNATQIPYVRYTFQLPVVRIPGNYLVVVYRGSDKNDLILSKRFMVYDSQVSLSRGNNLVGGQLAATNQQINFTIDYQNVNIPNPMTDVHVVIRQNQRWDNLAMNVPPSFVREINKELEYRFFDPDKMFKGGNEFRFFDLRSIISPGRNVGFIDKNSKPYLVHVAIDKSRHDDVYAQYNDINGQYYIASFDYRDVLAANYVDVEFTLATNELAGADVYVTGAFCQWNLTEENKMIYDKARLAYTAITLLKQGWYDYQYVVSGQDYSPNYFEGSHFETENSYEILVYFRPYQPRADLLVGYFRFTVNAR